jgi:glucose-1-phosphate adenylyltransferase
VEGSILAPGVRVKKGARVLNSIIMHDGEIGGDAVLDRVILDKKVTVGDRTRITGQSPIPNQEFPTHLSEGITLIGKRTVIPAGLTVKGNCLFFPGLRAGDFEREVIEDGTTVRPAGGA